MLRGKCAATEALTQRMRSKGFSVWFLNTVRFVWMKKKKHGGVNPENHEPFRT